MNIFLFKIIALFILSLFTFFVSDLRNKEGMTPLVKKQLIFFIKAFYSVPILVYIYTIMKLENIYISSYFGLVISCAGAILVIKAKVDLGKYHTWTGHTLSSTKIVKNGIYAFIRHPLYTGIHIFIFGGILIGINNNPFSSLTVSAILFFIFLIMLFLNFSALKENSFLHEKFGEDYLEYKRQVHAFLPIRKYSFNQEN